MAATRASSCCFPCLINALQNDVKTYIKKKKSIQHPTTRPNSILKLVKKERVIVTKENKGNIENDLVPSSENHREKTLNFNNKNSFKNRPSTHLILAEFCPETGHGSLVRVFGQEGSLLPCLINVFKNDKRFNDGSSIVNKNWNLFVDRIILKK